MSGLLHHPLGVDIRPRPQGARVFFAGAIGGSEIRAPQSRGSLRPLSGQRAASSHLDQFPPKVAPDLLHARRWFARTDALFHVAANLLLGWLIELAHDTPRVKGGNLYSFNVWAGAELTLRAVRM